mmetsp:Transcript_27704/g.38280  ORF Transcript_27704/g.38280 Transcript_27704/m.38280 type:complete len:114 (-) Transcript_27704:214-555(-)
MQDDKQEEQPERRASQLKSFHKNADPNAPLFEDWADSPSSFSVVRHSIKDMNASVFDAVRKNLPTMANESDDDDDNEDEETEVPMFTQHKGASARASSPIPLKILSGQSPDKS